ncbi:extensin family protein [Buttiauxella warmboldiae]|uniref:Extensin family protein n=1 Tax=Buttiauxella warmboldiae TaxID=82993 RepID=A0A3N5D2T2_9ENTR|nr:extensin family protein [Buttiauxella warmboldiae]RPH21882.1 extensin family protein [Buttiauxella warmboldiae]
MAKGVKRVMGLAIMVAAGFWLYERLPAQYNPFTPLSIDDPPTLVTTYKLRQMANHPQACLALLEQAKARGQLNFRSSADAKGNCPLTNVVRVQDFGSVGLSSSFLASCPLALSTTMFVHQRAVPLAQIEVGSKLTRINHLGSFACRNIYHREDARRSEHATADALDVSGFRFANQQQISVLKEWKGSGKGREYLHAVFKNGCPFFGNALGPEYNAAHASHFHLGMRGYGLCR